MLLRQISVMFIILILLSVRLFPQSTGTISGEVLDNKTGEKIIGATIFIENTSVGTVTNIEGKYSIKKIPEGTYTIETSLLSYAKIKITDVQVIDGKTTILNIALTPEAISLKEVVVTANMNNGYESAILNQQKKSITISDGISAELIKRSTDITTGEALKRISGIIISENKYVYVRGINERYSTALLNNSPLSSTEPDKKSFAFDLIPSNLIENVIVIKTFTPDNTGNFAGGLVKINTVDFPSQPIFNFNYNSSYIPGVSTKNYFSYQGGNKDFLGIDDGTRQLPDRFPDDISNIYSNKDSLYTLAKLLPNNWKITPKKAPLNQSFSLSYGDKYQVFGKDFGLTSSFSYRTSVNNSSILSKNISSAGTKVFDLAGYESDRSILWGALLNLSYQLADFHKISIKNSYSLNSDDEVIQLDGIQYDKSTDSKNTALRFTSRSLYGGQVLGEHHYDFLNNLNFQWRGSYSQSYRDEPDYRRYTYGRETGTEDPYFITLGPQATLGLGGRYFSKLKEYTREFGLDLSMPLNNITLKFGGSFNNSSRLFNSRLIGAITQINTSFKVLYYGIDSLFAPNNFASGRFSIGEYVNGTNNYSTNEEIFSFYGMLDIPYILFNQNIRLIGGARVENSVIQLRTFNETITKKIDVDNHDHDLLPSLNLIYQINENINLRLSGSQTINRPEFREIAPFSYYDFQTQTSLSGNDSLKSAKIANYDFRFEVFPEPGELFSASFFYKEIRNAIEKTVVISSMNEARTFSNASFAKNYGIELEARCSLKHLFNQLSNFNFSINYTWINSEINENSLRGNKIRPMQGQAPYVINFGFNYTNLVWGSSASIMFNKSGRRIVEVADQQNDDFFEEPRDVLDFVFSQKIINTLEFKISIKDILANDEMITQGREVTRLKERHTSFSTGISVNL